MRNLHFMFALLFVTLTVSSQSLQDLEKIRSTFQEIESEADIQAILDFKFNVSNQEIANVIHAYKGASQTMMANYVVSPSSKLKNFNKGKGVLEDSIRADKVVENVYLRIMIQLNAPKIVNYRKNIDSDLQFLEQNLVSAALDLDFKKLMIENLMSVVKKKEREAVLQELNQSLTN